MSFRYGLCAALACSCGGLEPILAPDGGVDASTEASPDASQPFDAGGDGAPEGGEAAAPFTCGTKVCDSNTHYCEKKSAADAGPLDAGAKDGGVEVDTCIAYPVACADDGGKPSCSCILELCTCVQNGTEITVTCP